MPFRKLLSLLLIVSMLLCLSACGGTKTRDDLESKRNSITLPQKRKGDLSDRLGNGEEHPRKTEKSIVTATRITLPDESETEIPEPRPVVPPSVAD